ncbi:MAG: hypothetical protein LLG02_02300 [Pelosinus sp.]|nr:hypothetical protein [Pelosinus sp.]
MHNEKDRANAGNNSNNNRLMLVYLVMAIPTIVLMGVAYVLAPEKIALEINKSAFTLMEALPAVAISILVTAVITALIAPQLITKWAGNNSGITGVLIAAGAGALIPCDPALGLPMIWGIARSGAGIGFIVALLTSSKLFSFMRIPDYFTFLNLELATFFLCSNIIMPFLSGLLANFLAGYFPSIKGKNLIQGHS